MRRPSEPLFLARDSYRRRRLGDAAKVLPVVGVFLLFLPILWADEARTAGGLLYVFGIWALLIVVVGWTSALLVRSEPAEENDPAEGGPD